MQERINRLQDKLDGVVTKKGKPFTKKGKEGLQKQIDNRTEELRELYKSAGIEEDVATVIQSIRERSKAQQEVDNLQSEFDQEKNALEEQNKQDKRADALSDLKSSQKNFNQEISEMKSERERLAKGGLGDSPKAKELNKQIASAEKELSRTNLEVQQSRMADQKKKQASVN